MLLFSKLRRRFVSCGGSCDGGGGSGSGSGSGSGNAPTCHLLRVIRDVLLGFNYEEGEGPSCLVQAALDGHAQVEVADQDTLVGRQDCVFFRVLLRLGCAADLTTFTDICLGHYKWHLLWFANQLI